MYKSKIYWLISLQIRLNKLRVFYSYELEFRFIEIAARPQTQILRYNIIVRLSTTLHLLVLIVVINVLLSLNDNTTRQFVSV